MASIVWSDIPAYMVTASAHGHALKRQGIWMDLTSTLAPTDTAPVEPYHHRAKGVDE